MINKNKISKKRGIIQDLTKIIAWKFVDTQKIIYLCSVNKRY